MQNYPMDWEYTGKGTQQQPKNDYKKIANHVVNEWCAQLRLDIKNIKKFYDDRTLFTFFNKEYLGFDRLYEDFFKKNMINEMSFDPKQTLAQPVGNNILIITIGTFKVKSSNFSNIVNDKPAVVSFSIEKNTMGHYRIVSNMMSSVNL
jgi:hypothetical protein